MKLNQDKPIITPDVDTEDEDFNQAVKDSLEEPKITPDVTKEDEEFNQAVERKTG